MKNFLSSLPSASRDDPERGDLVSTVITIAIMVMLVTAMFAFTRPLIESVKEKEGYRNGIVPTETQTPQQSEPVEPTETPREELNNNKW